MDHISFRLSAEDVEMLRTIARREERSISFIIRRMIREKKAQDEQTGATQPEQPQN